MKFAMNVPPSVSRHESFMIKIDFAALVLIFQQAIIGISMADERDKVSAAKHWALKR